MTEKKQSPFLATDFNQTPDFATLEEKIADYWDQQQIFARSLDQTKDNEPFIFYDGPPFATGLPHYGHLLASTTKDVFPRFQTMLGRYVKRVWGWDCHGLPIENIVEKELNLANRHDIETHGVEKFCQTCCSKVQLYAGDWKKVIRRLGRFVDMEHPYKTMDLSFMENEWSIFKTLWEKGLIYQDYKPMYICPRCATPLANFEVTQEYQEDTDISVYVKFNLLDPAGLGLDQPTAVVAWTTTPWTLPGNFLLAVGPKITYSVVALDENPHQYLIMASERLNDVLVDKKYQLKQTLLGSELVGRRYQPLFPYFATTANAFQIAEADFVTLEEGTGIVHVAPAYGEDDFNLGKRVGVPITHHVNLEGRFTSEVTDFAGLEVKPAAAPQATDIEIIKYLAHHDQLLAKKKIVHSYPHCWRCDSPLLNYATSSFFVKVTALRDELIENNQKINWLPAHFRDGRFGKWLADTRDWAISRQRFWGTPLPLWQADGGDFICVGSRRELEELSGQTVPDLHKPIVDKIEIVKNGVTYHRVSEVLDCWFESGSMPYAMGDFPADFISEGQDQTRGWFYTLHVLATALKQQPAFKNVLVNGIILAADGKKMSKKLHNYPDVNDIFTKYGADPLRLYLMTSPAMKAETLNFNEQDIARLRRQVLVITWNVLAFYRGALPQGDHLPTWEELWQKVERENVRNWHLLDQHLLSQTIELVEQVTDDLTTYEIVRAGRRLITYVDQLSTWYLRQSRERLTTDPRAQIALGIALNALALLFAPIMPFFAELLYHNLGGQLDSVHLAKWPEVTAYHALVNQDLATQMALLAELMSLGHAARKEIQIPVRQPLASANFILTTKQADLLKEHRAALATIIAEELNVKEVTWTTKKRSPASASVSYDTKLTPALINEGKAREIIRQIGRERKKLGLKPADKWQYGVIEIPAGYQQFIETKTNTRLELI